MTSSTAAYPEGLLVVKVEVERALVDASPGQNGIQVSAPKAREVYLLKGSLQQEFSCAQNGYCASGAI
jgi:hypothetical protein